MSPQTVVSIEGRAFHINGKPTYEGRTWRGHRIEGLLMNSRMVQATFDDLNPETRAKWDYPDGPWDAERNVREFLEAMPEWRRHGLLGMTVNFQGGNPRSYQRDNAQPWHNSTFRADGSMRSEYLDRMDRVLARADELGMAAIVGIFYFGQDKRLEDEAAICRALDNAVDWLCQRQSANVIIEIANEANVHYTQEIIKPDRCHELIDRARQRSQGRIDTPAGRLLVGISLGGGSVPQESIIEASDFLLLHGNGVRDPDRIRQMVRQCRTSTAYRDQPILFNEDDHYDFDQDDNNMIAAVSQYAGWGYFDYRFDGEGPDDGYQSVPANWGISSPRKRGFFNLLAQMTGAEL